MCNVQVLVTHGIVRMGEDAPEESLTYEYVPFTDQPFLAFDLWPLVTDCTSELGPLWYRQRREYNIFQKLLKMVPHLGDRFVECSNEELMAVADLVSLFCVQTLCVSHRVQDSEGCLQC